MNKNNWQAGSLFLTVLCLIHCVLTPFLVVLIPAAGEFIHHLWMEGLLLGLLLILGSLSLRHAYRNHHGSRLPFFLFLIGCGAIGYNIVSHPAHLEHAATSRNVVLIIGTAFLLGGQLLSLFLSRVRRSV